MSRTTVLACGIFAALLGCHPAHARQAIPDAAGEVTGELGFCGGMSDAKAQLRCFEDVARHHGAQVQVPVALTAGDGKGTWAVKTTRDARGSPVATAALSTKQTTGGDILSDAVSTLYLHCADKELSLYVEFGHLVATEPVTVDMRLDDDTKPRQWQWFPSARGSAIGLWSSQQAVPLAQVLLQAHDFAITVHQSGNQRLSAHFALAGMAAATKDVRAACNW